LYEPRKEPAFNDPERLSSCRCSRRVTPPRPTPRFHAQSDVFPIPFRTFATPLASIRSRLPALLTCVSHASSLCETRSHNPHFCFLRVSLTRSPSRFLSSRKRDFSGLVRDLCGALQRLIGTRITMRSTDVCQPSLKCGHPCLAGSGFLSKLSLRPHPSLSITLANDRSRFAYLRIS